MTRIMKTFLIILLSVNALATKAQNKFPDSWLGTYKGTLYIFTQKEGLKDSLDVKFELLPDSINRWIYRMTYKSTRFGEVIKDYYLIKPDSLPQNSFLLDEKDGILILQTYMDNCLYSSFSVVGNYISSTIRKKENTIYFEVFSSMTKENLKAQNNAKKGQTVFTVRSFPPFSTQKAKLKKVKY